MVPKPWRRTCAGIGSQINEHHLENFGRPTVQVEDELHHGSSDQTSPLGHDVFTMDKDVTWKQVISADSNMTESHPALPCQTGPGLLLKEYLLTLERIYLRLYYMHSYLYCFHMKSQCARMSPWCGRSRSCYS